MPGGRCVMASRPSNEELERRARGVLVENGFILDGPVLFDGARHYCDTTEKKGRNAAYVAHLGPRPRVRMKWYYRVAPDDWKVVKLCEAGPMTPEALATYRAECAAAIEARAREADEAAQRARHDLEKRGRPSDGSEPYSQAKGMPAVPGLFSMNKGKVLVVPARNAKKELRFLQRIYFDKELDRYAKLFTKGCAKSGCFFELPGTAEGGDAYFCEGVADGASIWEALGRECPVFVCFDCGNLLPVARALIDAGRVAGKDCIFVGDNDWGRPPLDDGRPDNPGVTHAIKAAQAVDGSICIPAMDGEQDSSGARVKDANDVHMAHGLAELAQRLERVETPPMPEPDKASPQDIELDELEDYMEGLILVDEAGDRPVDAEPMPLRRKMPLQAPYPVDAFGSLAGTVNVLAKHCYIHPSVAGIVVLCSLSLLAQRLFNVKSRLYTTPLSLYGLPIMESGGGKDVAEGYCLKVAEEWEREQEEVYAEKAAAYQVKETAYQTALKALSRKYSVAGKDFDREGYEKALADLEKSREPAPILPLLTSDDLNMEGLYRLLKEGMASHGIFGTEGGNLFGGIAFQKDNRTRSQAVLCGVWSKGEMRKLRMCEGLSKVRDRRVCMCIMVQPCIAEKLVADREMVGQGFLPRCLLTWPAPIGRDVVDIDVAELPEMQEFYQECRTLLDMKPPENDKAGKGLQLKDMMLTGECFDMYRAFYRELEKEILPGRKYEPIRAYARRGAEQATRIAGVLTAAWAPYSNEVHLEAMEAGVRIARWHLDEALRITLSEADPPEVKAAEGLMQWLVAKGISRTSAPQIEQFGPGALRTKAAVDAAVKTLVDHGWLKHAGRGEVWMGEGKTALARQTFLVVPGYGRQ